MNDTPEERINIAHRQHSRHWRNNAYCYPVVSRRSGGLSIGINLNPDKACNFNCIYCQVDRTTPAKVRKVDLAVLKVELEQLLDTAVSQSLFAEAPFDCLGPSERDVRDIAFSGDGEPTTHPRFDEAVRIAVEARRTRGLVDTKLVLITNACYLAKPKVRVALRLLDENNGEIWAKLDAGTQAYYETVNRPNYPLRHVIENITTAARVRPIVIQSLWMRLHDKPPPEGEVHAFADRLNEIASAGGQIKLVQVYTVARRTTEPHATGLSRDDLDRLAATIRARVNLPMKTYYGMGS
ncbi:MAG: radical SAM protein [Phycisphaerae bacterium]|nr:radical SAM protein [Phycisphaerae bacterium]